MEVKYKNFTLGFNWEFVSIIYPYYKFTSLSVFISDSYYYY